MKSSEGWAVGPRDLLQRVSEELARLGIRHFVTGSMGSMAYGEYRSTIDVDIVADMTPTHVSALMSAFPEPDHYLSEEAMREAIRARTQFNLIHVSTGLKVDFMIPEASPFNASRFARMRSVALSPECRVPVASAEDIILMKLRYFSAGGSDKHLRDIAGMLRIMRERLDRPYVEQWAGQLGVRDLWQAVSEVAD